MRDKKTVENMLDVMRGQSRTTRAPDFFHGVIDALEWVIAESEDDVPPTMLAWHWMLAEPEQTKEST